MQIAGKKPSGHAIQFAAVQPPLESPVSFRRLRGCGLLGGHRAILPSIGFMLTAPVVIFHCWPNPPIIVVILFCWRESTTMSRPLCDMWADIIKRSAQLNDVFRRPAWVFKRLEVLAGCAFTRMILFDMFKKIPFVFIV
jgi:hypothetical protein